MSTEPPNGPTATLSLQFNFNEDQNVVFVTMSQPESVGAEETMDQAIAQHGLEHEKRIAKTMGPEVLQWILPAATGGILVGIAAVITAWCRRHRDAWITMNAGVGVNFELEGKPTEAVSDEQIQEMVDLFIKAARESIEADDDSEQGESDSGNDVEK